MTANAFLDAVDDEKIIVGIHQAEATSGVRIRVHVLHQSSRDPTKAARRAFDRFESCNPRSRGHVLIFIAPQSQTFALHGSDLVHTVFGADGWKGLTDQLSLHFQSGHFTAGLLDVIQTIANRTAKNGSATG